MMGNERRGSDFYEDASVRAMYLAHRHSGARSPNVIMEEPAFLAAIGSPVGQRIADLGCGDGATASTLLGLGAAEYVGIDGSAGMIAAADKHHGTPDARFVHQDIEDLDLEDGSFDLIVSRMAFHYIDQLGDVLDRVHQSLRPGGRLVFSVTHPVITSHDAQTTGPRTTWTVDDYFVRGPRPRPWFGATVVWHHRTIEDYVQLVLGHGFNLQQISECEPSPTALTDHPDELHRRRRVPLVLLVAAQRTNSR